MASAPISTASSPKSQAIPTNNAPPPSTTSLTTTSLSPPPPSPLPSPSAPPPELSSPQPPSPPPSSSAPPPALSSPPPLPSTRPPIPSTFPSPPPAPSPPPPSPFIPTLPPLSLTPTPSLPSLPPALSPPPASAAPPTVSASPPQPLSSSSPPSLTSSPPAASPPTITSTSSFPAQSPPPPPPSPSTFQSPPPLPSTVQSPPPLPSAIQSPPLPPSTRQSPPPPSEEPPPSAKPPSGSSHHPIAEHSPPISQVPPHPSPNFLAPPSKRHSPHVTSSLSPQTTPATPYLSPPNPNLDKSPLPSPGASNSSQVVSSSARSRGNDSSNSSSKSTAVQGKGISAGSHSGMKIGSAVALAVVASVVVLGMVGFTVWFMRKCKKLNGVRGGGGYVIPSPILSSEVTEYSKSPSDPLMRKGAGSSLSAFSPSEPGFGSSRSPFTYEELYESTGGFSSKNLLGEGGFGFVYRGCLPDGREVAVKQLKVGGNQGDREFRAEVETISRVHHRHLVSLVGYCIAENQRLLVYDYVPNSTLHYHLHDVSGPTLKWSMRVKVAAGAARGLAYLHEDCYPRIIHRDIKSSNILLDNCFEALVSDFGLARLCMDANTHVTTRVMGTFGYLAPEYASSGKLTDKSDVYSFGVVLLELITGRKPVDSSQLMGEESLVEWARPLLTRAVETRDFQGLADPRLEGYYNKPEMLCMIEAAASCTRFSAAMRPRMGQVVRALDNLAEIDSSDHVAPGQSEQFPSGLHSADIRKFERMAFGSQDYSSEFSEGSSSNIR